MSGSNADDDLGEAEVEHGLWRSRRLTHFPRRDSSALYPAQMMEAEVHYNFAENAALESLHLLEILLNITPTSPAILKHDGKLAADPGHGDRSTQIPVPWICCQLTIMFENGW